MISKEDFLTEFNGHGNAYASFMVIGPNIDNLLKTLNDINPNMCVGSGVINEKSISFEICKECPDLIYDITARLQCTGYADMGAWYGEAYFIAAKNGQDHVGFSADWAEDNPVRRDWDYDEPEAVSNEEVDWDAFVVITDDETGETFNTGDGAIDYEQYQKWEDLVQCH